MNEPNTPPPVQGRVAVVGETPIINAANTAAPDSFRQPLDPGAAEAVAAERLAADARLEEERQRILDRRERELAALTKGLEVAIAARKGYTPAGQANLSAADPEILPRPQTPELAAANQEATQAPSIPIDVQMSPDAMAALGVEQPELSLPDIAGALDLEGYDPEGFRDEESRPLEPLVRAAGEALGDWRPGDDSSLSDVQREAINELGDRLSRLLGPDAGRMRRALDVDDEAVGGAIERIMSFRNGEVEAGRHIPADLWAEERPAEESLVEEPLTDEASAADEARDESDPIRENYEDDGRKWGEIIGENGWSLSGAVRPEATPLSDKGQRMDNAANSLVRRPGEAKINISTADEGRRFGDMHEDLAQRLLDAREPDTDYLLVSDGKNGAKRYEYVLWSANPSGRGQMYRFKFRLPEDRAEEFDADFSPDQLRAAVKFTLRRYLMSDENPRGVDLQSSGRLMRINAQPYETAMPKPPNYGNLSSSDPRRFRMRDAYTAQKDEAYGARKREFSTVWRTGREGPFPYIFPLADPDEPYSSYIK